MISDEIRNRTEAKSDIQKSKNNSRNKKVEIPEIEKKELWAPHSLDGFNET